MEEKEIVVASSPAPSLEMLTESPNVPEKEAESLEEQANEDIKLDENGQKIYSLVQEVADLFRERIAKGEISPYDVAEALAVTLSGTIYSTVPPQHHKVVNREAEGLNKKLLKAFDHQVQKKNYMFASQLLGAAKTASYIMGHGNNILKRFKQGQAEAAKQAVQDLDSKITE